MSRSEHTHIRQSAEFVEKRDTVRGGDTKLLFETRSEEAIQSCSLRSDKIDYKLEGKANQ